MKKINYTEDTSYKTWIGSALALKKPAWSRICKAGEGRG